jgi:hypothetical protein
MKYAFDKLFELLHFSLNRKEKYKEFLDFMDTEPSKIIKFPQQNGLA